MCVTAPYINQAQRPKECVLCAPGEAGFQFILPSEDSSCAEEQLAQLGSIVTRLLRL